MRSSFQKIHSYPQHTRYVIHESLIIGSNSVVQPVAGPFRGLSPSPLLHQSRFDAAAEFKKDIVSCQLFRLVKTLAYQENN